MVIAKKMILKLCKSDSVPQFKIWLSELIDVLHMEKVQYGMMDNLNTFSDIWPLFLAHLDTYNIDLDQQGSSWSAIHVYHLCLVLRFKCQ